MSDKNERASAVSVSKDDPKDNDALVINGVPVESVIARAGRTPIYAYDRQLITLRVQALRQALPKKIKLHYAIKANPMPAMISHLLPLVDGFDVASQGELLAVLNAGASPSTTSFAGPGKTDTELVAAIASEICISVESPNELMRCSKLAGEIGTTARICVRVNPTFELKQSGMKMTGRASQFGTDVADVKALLSEKAPENTCIIGVHIYSGSQNLHAEALIETCNQTLDLASELMSLTASRFEFVNIGGGFGIPYFAHEQAFDLAAVGDGLAVKLDDMKSVFSETDIVIELGRYIVGEAGYYITTVIDTKVSRGEKFVVVDGGLHHHLANSGNFGQILRKNYPVVVTSKHVKRSEEVVTIVGPLCTPLDIVASEISLPKIEVGDRIAVLQSGAYGYSASPLKFLSHAEPVELLV